ncbi:MAG: ATP-binding protein [Deferrisomatales bacterium]|nr:ATP-binding protein [Deferrisomatales bacterium]
MKKVFATTRNVRAFYSAMELINGQGRGKAEMALVSGVFGTGKTETCQKFAADNDLIYVRALDVMTRKSLLAAIAGELGEKTKGHSDTLYYRVVDRLIDRPQMLICDEVDYLVSKGIVEVLRDIYDHTNNPLVLVGMNEDLEREIKTKLPHLSDRWGAVVRFQRFEATDVRDIAAQICEVELDDSAVEWITTHGEGRFRPIERWFYQAEKLARVNGLHTVSALHLEPLKSKTNGRKKARR